MNGNTAVDLLWFLGSFVMVGSALLARRLSLTDSIKMALAWLAIFGLVFLVIWTYLWASGG